MVNRIPNIDQEGMDSEFSEAYRTLRTNLQFIQPDEPLQTLMVTSGGPKEGKTSVAVNLGTVLAEMGSEVLLVDANFRSPALGPVFGLASSPGLSDAMIESYGTKVTVGTVDEFTMGDVFELISMQERTGLLTVQAGKDLFHISFEGGQVVDVQWVNRPETKKLGSMLVRSGRITQEQAEEALSRRAETVQRLGYVLVSLGYVEPQDIEGPIGLHVMESLSKVFGFKEACFQFEERSMVDCDRGVFDAAKMCRSVLDRIPGSCDQKFIQGKILEAVQDSEVENLCVLASGTPVPNPSELFSSQRMRGLIKILMKNFDLIIFDSPPVSAGTDALLLGSLLDGVVLVLQPGLFNRDLAQSAKEKLENVKASIYGVVLNQMDDHTGKLVGKPKTGLFAWKNLFGKREDGS